MDRGNIKGSWRVGVLLSGNDAEKLHYILREEEVSLTTFFRLIIRNKYKRMMEEKRLANLQTMQQQLKAEVQEEESNN